ncbi:hypothetical protein RB614_32265 [Phytohabitans sp. ZYX-F-186]|uniref:Uncharacterized protein n=1 Tax=Phytohabitans maris TaxID=3071409 RepID=A0ABU0ZQA9_9ACTN|nr:hypothetical protein [Phytohabitans sp. ZYX-F-186]MDQ7909207.1 hypothetical protein [Phytohabitans sp. ZYX-F-186]
MQNVMVGQVSTRKGAKLHLSLNGLAHCGSGNGRIIGPARELTADNTPALCLRCAHRVKAVVQEDIHEVMRRRDQVGLRRLNKLADALLTPAEVKAEEKTIREIEAGLKATAEGRRPRTFAEIRAAHLAAVQRDRMARAEQLALV